MSICIDRGFQRITTGLIHFREARPGTNETPLVMIHGGPGSSASMVPMILALAVHRHVIAPDLPGNGDSDPPAGEPISMVMYARAIAEFLDARGIAWFDLYGHHSGAQIACELAIARPASVRRMILDGVALFSPEQRNEFIARYAPPIVPHEDGGHLLWAWDFSQNLTRYFPHYRRDDASRLVPRSMPPAEVTTRITVDLLKAWPSYHLLYQAAFSHDIAGRLPLVRTPTLVLKIAGDPLAHFAMPAADLLSESRTSSTSRDERIEVIDAFLCHDS